jgi:hypothetical protein
LVNKASASLYCVDGYELGVGFIQEVLEEIKQIALGSSRLWR